MIEKVTNDCMWVVSTFKRRFWLKDQVAHSKHSASETGQSPVGTFLCLAWSLWLLPDRF